MMKFNHSEDLRIRTIKCFADVIILKYLKSRCPSSGYQIVRFLHDDYDLMLSPGTVYSALNLLERKGLIKADGVENGRIYHLTDKGEKALSCTAEASEQIQKLIVEIFSEGAATSL